MTRARPYKHNDNAHVEQKNGAIVRREAFRYRYETAERSFTGSRRRITAAADNANSANSHQSSSRP